MVHWWGSAVWWTVRMWRVFEPLVAKIFPQKLHRRSSSENSDIPVIKIRLFDIKIETRSGYYLSNLFRFLFTQNTVSRDLFFNHKSSGICGSCSCASWGHWHSCNFCYTTDKRKLSPHFHECLWCACSKHPFLSIAFHTLGKPSRWRSLKKNKNI